MVRLLSRGARTRRVSDSLDVRSHVGRDPENQA